MQHCPLKLGMTLSRLCLVICLMGLNSCASEEVERRLGILQDRTARLEQALSQLEIEHAGRIAQVRESLKADAAQIKADREHLRVELNGRLEEVYRQLEIVRKDIIAIVQKANGATVKELDDRVSSLDVLLGTILLRIEELEKRPQQLRK